MGISNNAPTMSYIHISGTSVVWNNETYMVQDFATNKRYIYWNADTPHQLNASNVMPNRSTKQYLVIVNDNGMHSLVPSTSDDFSISFEGNSNQAIKDRIFGLYEKNEEFGDKFVAIEQGIDGIKSIVGETEETTDGTLIDRMSKVEQRADEINLSVEGVSKKYNDDKEINELRESLNSSVIKLNSALGTFKSELTDYFKNNEISSEEKTKIKTQLEVLTNRKITLEGYVNTVRLIAEKNNQTQDVVALDSAKKSLQTAHDNLHNNINNAVIDNIITPTENTIIIDSFAKYNLKINELKNTCDDIIFLGVGGVITEELANISIKSNEINLSVSKKVDSNSIISAINLSPESIKISSSKINITGFVTFTDLSTPGSTTISGSNIITGTLDTNKVNIKGSTTKKIVIGNDNYCVYDGAETDINRKVFVGFRTNSATNVPSVMLGYNGINPSVDGAVVSGGTYTTYSHYPNNNNPESINQSYGALAFKYGAGATQFSTLNMYQSGDIDLKAGKSIYFRPSLRAKDNHVFAITDTSVGSRVPFQCTSTIYANGNITTDGNLTSTTANVGRAMNAGSVVTNRIDVYGSSNLDGTAYISGTCTIAGELNVKNRAIYGMNNIALARGTVYLPQGGGNNTVDYLRTGGGFMATSDWGNFHFLTRDGSVSNIFAGNVTSAYSLEPIAKTSNRSVFDEINSIEVIDTTEGFRLMDTSARLTSTNETPKAVFTTYNEKTEQEEVNINYTTAISTLWKAIQELKQENEELLEIVNTII